MPCRTCGYPVLAGIYECGEARCLVCHGCLSCGRRPGMAHGRRRSHEQHESEHERESEHDPVGHSSHPQKVDTDVFNSDLTIGEWITEEASCAALDAALDSLGLWKVYHEVNGVLTQPRPVQTRVGVRIDRVLIPTKRLLDMGWKHGAVGIEVKRSGEKIGPAISQAMDYLRAVWQLPSAKIVLDWVFIWPMFKHSGTIASILAQQRIGCAYADRWT